MAIRYSSLLIQAQNLKVCSLDEELKKKLKKFRFRKATSNAAIISEWVNSPRPLAVTRSLSTVKIDPDTMTVIEDPTIDEDETQVSGA